MIFAYHVFGNSWIINLGEGSDIPLGAIDKINIFNFTIANFFNVKFS